MPNQDHSSTREVAVNTLRSLEGKRIETVTVTQRKDRDVLAVVLVLSEEPLAELQINCQMVSIDDTSVENILKDKEFDRLDERTWKGKNILLTEVEKLYKSNEKYDISLSFQS